MGASRLRMSGSRYRDSRTNSESDRLNHDSSKTKSSTSDDEQGSNSGFDTDSKSNNNNNKISGIRSVSYTGTRFGGSFARMNYLPLVAVSYGVTHRYSSSDSNGGGGTNKENKKGKDKEKDKEKDDDDDDENEEEKDKQDENSELAKNLTEVPNGIEISKLYLKTSMLLFAILDKNEHLLWKIF